MHDAKLNLPWVFRITSSFSLIVYATARTGVLMKSSLPSIVIIMIISLKSKIKIKSRGRATFGNPIHRMIIMTRHWIFKGAAVTTFPRGHAY